MTNMTGIEMLQAINAAKNTLDKDDLKQAISFQIAADYNVRRKLAMIDATLELYEYLHGSGKPPETIASKAFNPHDGVDKTNIYYIFKELYKGMPWEIRRDNLVKPIALTLTLFDMLDKLFPHPIVYHGKMTVQGFVNLCTLPVERSEISDEEKKRKRDDYFTKMHRYEERFVALYEDLTAYFAELEDPDKNPITKKISETHSRTKKIEETTTAINNRDKANRSINKLTLYEASGQNPVYKPTSTKEISSIKNRMVELAINELQKSDALSARSICANILRKFEKQKGAYTDLEVFRRQVTRTMKKLGQKV